MSRAQPDHPTLRRIALSASIGVVVIALAVSVGWIVDEVLIASVSKDYVPMTLSVAISVLLLSLAIMTKLLPVAQAKLVLVSRALAVVVLAMSVWNMVESVAQTGFDLDEFLNPTRETSEGYLIAEASPISSVTLAAAALALILSIRYPQALQVREFATAFLALFVFSIGLVITLGYAYGNPLMYGGDVRPVSLLSGVSFSLLGTALIAMQGPDQWPTRVLVGPSVEARLLRAFVPLVVFVVLVSGSLSNRALTQSSNPALTASLIALVTAIVVGYVVLRLSRHIGREIDTAESSLRKAQEEIRTANEKLQVLGSITRHDSLNQLVVVIGRLELLKMSTKDPAVLKQANECLSSAGAIQRILQFTSEYQKIGVSRPDWVDVETAFAKGVRDARLSSIEVHSELRGLEVLADTMFEKVLSNLVDNSVRHGQRVRNIRLSFRPDGDGVVIVYEDDGVGLSEAEKRTLFEPGLGKHTGFGMYLSKEILQFTGLAIRETGTPGEGARFEISVPAGKFRTRPA